MILGHAFPSVVEAIREAAAKGASFGASTAAEIELAELVRQCFPSAEKLRFVSSGTEASIPGCCGPRRPKCHAARLRTK